jgi:hypothetical protein
MKTECTVGVHAKTRRKTHETVTMYILTVTVVAFSSFIITFYLYLTARAPPYLRNHHVYGYIFWSMLNVQCLVNRV